MRANERNLDRLQDADGEQQHKSDDNDADKNELPERLLAVSLVREFTPVPRIGIIRVGRHRANRRGHRSSVGTTPKGVRLIGGMHRSFGTVLTSARGRSFPTSRPEPAICRCARGVSILASSRGDVDLPPAPPGSDEFDVLGSSLVWHPRPSK